MDSKQAEIEQMIKQLVADEQAVDVSTLNSEDNFHHMGLDSISSIFVLNELEHKYDIQLKPMHLWNNPTIGSFASFVHQMIHESK